MDRFLVKDSLRKRELTLSPISKGFSQREGVDLVKVFASVAEGSEVNGQVTYGFKLKMALHGPMHALGVWNFRIDKFLFKLGFPMFSADFSSLFDKSDPFILALYLSWQ